MFPVAPRPESDSAFSGRGVSGLSVFVAGKRSAIEFCRREKALAIANPEK
jgi:hypothetical protein